MQVSLINRHISPTSYDKTVSSPNLLSSISVKNIPFNFKSLTNDDKFERCQVGYPYEKRKILNTLLNTINASKEENSVLVPPLFLVYAPDRLVKSNLKQGLQDSLEGKNCVTTWDSNISTDDFVKNLRLLMQGSKKQYLDTGKRTVLFIDDIEKYISASSYNNVNALKSILDYCSKVPKHEEDSNAALTLLAFTDNPLVIDKELLNRPEKTYAVAFSPVFDDYLQDILKQEVKHKEGLLTVLKSMSNDAINKISFPFKTWKSIKSLKENGHLASLTTGYQKIPFDIISKFLRPSDSVGAYTPEQISEIVKKAEYSYIENPQKEFLNHLIEQLLGAKRNISPEQLKNEINIKNAIEFKRNKPVCDDVQKTRILFKNLQMGFLNSEQKYELAEKLFLCNVKRILLENKQIVSLINDDEKKTLQDLQALQRLEETSKNIELQRYKDKVIKDRVNFVEDGKYKFSYGNDCDDFVNLFFSSYGEDKSTLWIDAYRDNNQLVALHFIDSIIKNEPFTQVDKVEFPSEYPMGDGYVDVGRRTDYNVKIYKAYVKSNSS